MAQPAENTSPRTVIVVGAGFAGLVTARELERGGHDVTILEARDRIGGRTWTTERMGRPLELGGTWVHWMQPYTWNEVTRYGAEIVASPFVDRAYWITGDEVREGTEAELDAKIVDIQNAVFEGSREFFPRPHEPYAAYDADPAIRARMDEIDGADLMAQLDAGGFSDEEKDLVSAYWSAGYQSDPAKVSPLMAKHWAALSDHRLSLLDDQTLRWKLKNGMSQIYGGIAADIRGQIRLSTPVAALAHDENGARVTLTDGEELSADYVVVTAPLGALGTIEFTPALSEGQRDLIAEGFACVGFKIWIKVKGHHNVFAYAPAGHPLAMIRSEYFEDDDTTILVGFGGNRNDVVLDDVAQVQEIVSRWIPDLEVLDCTGHNWGEDQWSGQTWATPLKGQFTGARREFMDARGRLRFAGSDWAKGWNSFVDGAIETGITTARDIMDEIRAASE